MIYDRLRVFVSSKMEELSEERLAIKSALDALSIEAWVFEEDAGARPSSIRETYLDQLESSDLYIGVFWRGYGDYTIDEFDHAKKLRKDCLIYEKRTDIEGRDAQLQEFLDKLGKVESGLSIRWFETPEELQAAVHHDAARWQADIVRKYRTAHLKQAATPIAAADRDNLRILLDRVKRFWVDGVLASSTHGAGLLDLDKQSQTDAINHPWEAVLELPFEGNQVVSAAKRIADVFDDVDRSLLILGQPGSGKTTSLLELVQALVARVENDPDGTVPVVLNLSSWTNLDNSLPKWIENELSVKYQIPRRFGGNWLEEQRLLLMLDGLDEVNPDHQESCVNAINEFVETNGVPGIVVCSRLQDYSALSTKLKLNGAVCLQPLTNEQIFANISEGGPNTATLKTVLEKHEVMLNLAQSPLMLNIMTRAYQDMSAEELTGREFDTAEGCQQHLFETYVDRMLQRKGKSAQPFSQEQTSSTLTWLAQRMAEHNKSMLLMEDIQPSWLSGIAQHAVYLFVFCMSLGLLTGVVSVVFWLGVGPVFDVTQDPATKKSVFWLIIQFPVWFLMIGILDRVIPNTLFGRSNSLLSTTARAFAKFVVYLGLWLLWPLVAWSTKTWDPSWIIGDIIFGVTASSFFAILARNQRISLDVQTVESLRFSPLKAMQGFFWGSVVGFVIYQAYLWLWALLLLKQPPDWFPYFWQDKTWEEPLSCITYPVFGGVMGMVIGSLVPRVVKGKTTPNQGMRMSIRNSITAGILAAPLVGVTGLLLVQLWLWLPINKDTIFSPIQKTVLGLSFGVWAAFYMALWFGALDFLKHYLLRNILVLAGNLPRNFRGFLNYGVKLNILQRVGGGYIFVHRLLLEYFASLKSSNQDTEQRM